MQPWYNPRKAAQIIAFFATREGGQISVLKAVKLVYLADRLFMARFDSSMLLDQLVSMDHGPVNSITYNQINGLDPDREDWREFVSDRDNHDIAAARADFADTDFDELSRAELAVLRDVWTQFGTMTKWQVRDYTHDHCPEWRDPNGSSEPIPYRRLFAVLGKTDPEGLEHRIDEERELAKVMAA